MKKTKKSYYVRTTEYGWRRNTVPPIKRVPTDAEKGTVFIGLCVTPEDLYILDKMMYDFKVTPNSRSKFIIRAAVEKANKMRKTIKRHYKGESK